MGPKVSLKTNVKFKNSLMRKVHDIKTSTLRADWGVLLRPRAPTAGRAQGPAGSPCARPHRGDTGQSQNRKLDSLTPGFSLSCAGGPGHRDGGNGASGQEPRPRVPPPESGADPGPPSFSGPLCWPPSLCSSPRSDAHVLQAGVSHWWEPVPHPGCTFPSPETSELLRGVIRPVYSPGQGPGPSAAARCPSPEQGQRWGLTPCPQV